MLFEWVVIGVVAWWVLGPEKLAALCKQLGRWQAKFRDFQQDWQRQQQLEEDEEKAKQADRHYHQE